jgi:hypothetical protein
VETLGQFANEPLIDVEWSDGYRMQVHRGQTGNLGSIVERPAFGYDPGLEVQHWITAWDGDTPETSVERGGCQELTPNPHPRRHVRADGAPLWPCDGGPASMLWRHPGT